MVTYRTKRFIVKKPDEGHPFYEAYMRYYRDFLELKRVRCKCGKLLKIMETEGCDGSEVWAECPDEPDKRYIIEPRHSASWGKNVETIAETSESRVVLVDWKWY